MKIQLNEREVSLAEPQTIGELRAQFKPTADVLICNGAMVESTQLVEEGDVVMLIARGETPSPAEFESLMVSRHTPGVHAQVKQACVGIAGLGGLGSAVAVALTRMGVGKLICIDFDVVEPSNLNRQQYFVDQLGAYKTEALAANLARINPYVEVEIHTERITPANAHVLLGEADIWVEAFDRPDQKAMLMQLAGEKPFVGASGLAGYEKAEQIQVHKLGRSVYIVGDLTTGAAPGCGLMAPRVGVAAHLQANVVIELILGAR